MRSKEETLPSGKVILKCYNDKNYLVLESHSYDNVEIIYNFEHGKRTTEEYVVNKKFVSRKKYQNAIKHFEDMPLPTTKQESISASVIEMEMLEKIASAWEKNFDQHIPDPNKQKEIDTFSINLLKNNKYININQCKNYTNVLLGEYSKSRSEQILNKLLKYNCKNIFFGDYEIDNSTISPNNIIIELPNLKKSRKQILKYLHKLAQTEGFEGNFDENQQYEFIKF